jgi:single-strand DNA-binding protein
MAEGTSTDYIEQAAGPNLVYESAPASIAKASSARYYHARRCGKRYPPREEERMNSLNSILLEGNLVRDPEQKTLPSGSAVCDFTVASDRFYKQNEALEKEVSYFDVEAWSRLRAACTQNLKKGRGVRVVGRLKQDRWTDPEGRSRSRVKIVAEHVEFKPQKHASTSEAAAEEEPELAQAVAVF